MRLWSISPEYLDVKGLVALWREALLAQKVLAGKTCAYKNHPQLERFKNHSQPIDAIGYYLYEIYKEGKKRGYNFNQNKIISNDIRKVKLIKVSSEQIKFEFNHLLTKLEKRDKVTYIRLSNIKKIKIHPLFVQIRGKIENWEKASNQHTLKYLKKYS